ncbi:MAG: cytochrome c biogenesis protein ResB [Candidatus Brocadiales bacterium]|nr:cytochrome c biogenesis protein ResB [Candidatus Bathyanammoxibius amoris]
MVTKILEYLYGVLTSTKTTVVLFGMLMLFFFVGNVLPYGGDYEQIKVTGVVRQIIVTFDLLNVYSGPWFLTTVGLFFLSLGLCTYKRLKWMMRTRRPAQLAPTTLAAHRNALDLELPCSPEETSTKVETFFRHRMFLKKPSTIRGEDVYSGGVCEQGFIHYIWLSLAFHVSVLLTIIGAVITFLFAFESELTIFPGAPVKVATVSTDTWWNEWYGGGEDFIISEDEKFELGLKEFSIQYVQRPSATGFPRRGLIPRLKKVYSPGGLSIVNKEGRYFPIEYSSHLVISEHGVPVQEPLIKVNTPLHYRGLVLYQSAYDYKFDLYAGDEKIEEQGDDEGKYTIPGIEGEFETMQVIAGSLYLNDGSKCLLEPFVKFAYTPTEPEQEEGETKEEKPMPEVFKLIQGRGVDVKGTRLRIENIRAGTVLSYRHDPGVPLLWIAVPVLFFAMLFRAWGRWCRASYVVEKRPTGSRLLVHLQMFGVWGGEEAMLERLKSHLSQGTL